MIEAQVIQSVEDEQDEELVFRELTESEVDAVVGAVGAVSKAAMLQ